MTHTGPSAATLHEQLGDEGLHAGAEAGAASTVAAFLSNVGVAAAKFVAWGFTGSASMLAEAVHSVADTANQGLLLLGRHRARRPPTRRHPFGFGRERYFWSFVVAIVLFSAGSLFAFVQGEENLRQPHELTSYPWSLIVIVASVCFEGASLRTVLKESRAFREGDETLRRFIRRTSVPELAVIILEDSGALAGLLLALVATTLAAVTANGRFDALGGIGIGVLLAGIAFTLAGEMKSMLIGEAASADDVAGIRDVICSDPTTRRLRDLRTELLGPEEVLVVASVDLDAQRAVDLESATSRLEERIRERVPKARLIYIRAHPSAPAAAARRR